MKNRLSWIDIAKGICFIAVIYGHSGSEIRGFVYSFHLTVFFILSGYTLSKKPLSAGYFTNKFQRLMVPYFITCFAVGAMDVVNKIIIQKEVSIYAVTQVLWDNIKRCFFASGGPNANMGYIQVENHIGAIWFLPAMFFALVFVQLILNLFSKKSAQLVASLVVSALGAITAGMFYLPFSIQSGMLATSFILFGYYLAQYDLLSKIKWWHYVAMAGVYAVGLYTGFAQPFYMVNCHMKDWFLTPLCALCSSLLLLGICKRIPKFSPLEFVGKNSLVFLCVHLFEMNTLYPYYNMVKDRFGISYQNIPAHLAMEAVVVCLLSFAVIGVQKLQKSQKLKSSAPNAISAGKRDFTIDVMRALLIVLMLVGHGAINTGLSVFIYSFHMMAFVMISGYFFKSGVGLKENIQKCLKLLLPYSAFALLYVIVNDYGVLNEIKTVLLGVSFTDKLLPSATSVGPVYFILLLFAVRFIYIFVDLIKNEATKNIAVVVLFCAGIFLGKKGLWLPWSVDCALFSVAFFHIAHYIRKYNLLQKVKNAQFLYFAFALVWAFMIHCGSMEVAMRKYSNAGITVIGVVCAFMVIYLLCSYLASHLPKFVCALLSWTGQGTAHILIIHCLFGWYVDNFVQTTLGFDSQNIFHFAATILIQLALGVLSFLTINFAKTKIKSITKKPTA